MCSIFGAFDIKTDTVKLRKRALGLSRLVRHRGPDWSSVYACDNAILARERLSIVDVNAGAQPLYNVKKIHILAVNDEIYNYQTLRAEYGDRYQSQTGSDCKVIFALYQEKGPAFLDNLQGMFTFVLYDSEQDAYLIGHSHIGIILLYMGYDEHGNFYVASEMKALVPVCRTVEESPTSSYLWSKDGEVHQHYQCDWFEYDTVKDSVTDKNELHQALEDAVKGHLMSDVPYGVLLSGGLDSSVISVIAKKYAARHVENQERSEAWWPQLHSFTVGLEGAPDLKATQGMTNHLGAMHHEIHFTVQEGLGAIRGMIYHIETHDVTTIRASMPVYLMSRRIKTMGIKMMLSGEGSDEVFDGYLYFHKVLDAEELHEKTARRLQALHMFDCARVSRAISAWGVEAHVPFLDKKSLDVAIRINLQDKMRDNGKMERHVLHEYFESCLPINVAWCQKEQFSDGVGYSWIDTLKEVAVEQASNQQLETASFRFPYSTSSSKEAHLYREIFEELFPVVSATECVPGGPSVACSSAKAIEWDGAFKTVNDPSGHAVGVHQSAHRQVNP